jgi:hypothetical protein
MVMKLPRVIKIILSMVVVMIMEAVAAAARMVMIVTIMMGISNLRTRMIVLNHERRHCNVRYSNPNIFYFS